MPYRNPTVAKEVVPKYANRFRALYAAMGLGDAFIAAARGERPRSLVENIVGVIFTRAMNNVSASTILLEEGYPVEATMLTRGLIEDLINICYIAHHHHIARDKLAERFVRYQHVIKFDYYRKVKDEGGAVPEDRYREAKEGRRQFQNDYCKQPPYTDLADWSGLPLWKKARYAQVELKPAGEARDEQLREVYELLNPYFSETVHGGPHAWNQVVLEAEDKITYLSGPQDMEGAYQLAMPASAFLLSQIVKVAAEVYQLPTVQAQAVQTQRIITELLKDSDSGV